MDSAGVEIIEVYQQFSIWAVIAVIVGVFVFLCAIKSLMIGCEKDDGDYFVMAGLFIVFAVMFLVLGIPHVYERGFKAKVDNITAWAEISVNYAMTDLDENGVFTFRER